MRLALCLVLAAVVGLTVAGCSDDDYNSGTTGDAGVVLDSGTD